MEKNWILVLDPQSTLEDKTGELYFALQEVEYKTHLSFQARDLEAARDYCYKVLGLDPNYIY